MFNLEFAISIYLHGVQLHTAQHHADQPMLVHVQELLTKLDELGITPSPEQEGDEDEGSEGWGDDDEDVDMA